MVQDMDLDEEDSDAMTTTTTTNATPVVYKEKTQMDNMLDSFYSDIATLEKDNNSNSTPECTPPVSPAPPPDPDRSNSPFTTETPEEREKRKKKVHSKKVNKRLLL